MKCAIDKLDPDIMPQGASPGMDNKAKTSKLWLNAFASLWRWARECQIRQRLAEDR
jgi:hypothetical protein